MLSPTAIRERVFVEIERLRPIVEAALTPGRSNELSWLECQLWVDRSRSLVLERGFARDKVHAVGDRVPDQYQEELQFWGSRYHFVSSWDLVELLAAFIRGDGAERCHGGKCSAFINYAIVQPLVNPAFKSLFWLALDRELHRDRAPSQFLGDGLGAMVFDMARYPSSKSDAAAVRDAQVQFVAEYLDENLPQGKWRYASDEDWARHCADLLADNKAEWVFTKVANAVDEP